MLELILLVIRGIQALFSIIVLGLTSYVADVGSYSRNSFLLFVSVWTLLVLLYLALAPRFAKSAAIPAAILAVDALTMLFWFAGFIAQAVAANDVDEFNRYYFGARGCDYTGHWCGSIKASAAFGAFEWALFVVTTIFAALTLFRGRKSTTTHHTGEPMATA